MRLIDADKLKKDILLQNILGEPIQNIIDRYIHIVNEQPTAFDVDKVVEQIESIKEKEYRACTDAQCGFCDYSNDCWDGEMCDKLALDKAIGLVKEGGVE